MQVNPLQYKPQGDKKNSAYFDEYRIKIYERRISSGLQDLLGNIAGVAVQVQSGDGLKYLKELCFMTPYRYKASFRSETHNIYCLQNVVFPENRPVFFVLEPLDPNYEDDIVRINRIYPIARKKCQARYVGEIFQTKDKDETKKILQSHSVNFYDTERQENPFYSTDHVHFTRVSDFTYNRMGYTDVNLLDFASLDLGKPFELKKDQLDELKKQDEIAIQLGIKPLIKGIDHLAARVLASEREDALLELLCLTNYYYWGGFDVVTMNTVTCATRACHGQDDISPAKVISAGDTPYMINSFIGTPMPTEDFVRNYGRRLHHMAYAIIDGDHPSGVKNIDYFIDTLHNKAHIEFVSKLVGACDESALRQTFAKASEYSSLFTEYVQRCHGYTGFLNRENVVELAGAVGTAGEKLQVIKKRAKENIVGD